MSVKYSHVVWMRENYFICSRKIGSNQRRARKKEKTIYECYDLDGNYINVIGTVRDEDDYFCAFMYKETPNMIALGSNDSYPFLVIMYGPCMIKIGNLFLWKNLNK